MPMLLDDIISAMLIRICIAVNCVDASLISSPDIRVNRINGISWGACVVIYYHEQMKRSYEDAKLQ